MGTSNSTRRASGNKGSGKLVASLNNRSRQQLGQTTKEEVLPAYRKPELQDFDCVICKDLVFKPVVNACGHAFFCFWCAHESMGAGYQSSTCPMCRSTFSHMPRVCELAHCFLTKMWPQEYYARAAEVEEEEKQRNMFSPEPIGLPQTACKRLQVDAAFRSTGKEAELPGPLDSRGKTLGSGSEIVDVDGGGPAVSLREVSSSTNLGEGAAGGDFTAGDCECLLCNRLLFQPVVLSCGHAYCFLCLEERFPAGRVVCAYCQKPHLEAEVTVCGALQELIQGAFPAETHQRIRQEHARMGNRKGLLRRVSAQEEEQEGRPKGFVHFGIECDLCGVYPIVGERYQCQDCQEEIGFDLCEACHGVREQPMLGSYLFKQKHLPSHRMHRVEPVPTFLHQVMETHPELSVATVINMVMSMAEEMAEAGGAEELPPLEDNVVNLAETNLFDEPQVLPEGGAAASLGRGVAAGDGRTQEEEPGTPRRPMDLTSQLVRTVLELAEAEQAALGASRQEQGENGASGNEGSVGVRGETEQAGDVANGSQVDEQRNLQLGGVASSGSSWAWEDSWGQLAGAERGQDAGGQPGAHRLGPATSPFSEDPSSVAFDGTRLWEAHPAGGEVASCSVEQGTSLAEEVGASATDKETEESHEHPSSGGGQGEWLDGDGRQQNGDETRQTESMTVDNQVDSWPRNASGRGRGRGRAFAEERRTADEQQHRASCEPGLRRSDSYHQLMMASA